MDYLWFRWNVACSFAKCSDKQLYIVSDYHIFPHTLCCSVQFQRVSLWCMFWLTSLTRKTKMLGSIPNNIINIVFSFYFHQNDGKKNVFSVNALPLPSTHHHTPPSLYQCSYIRKTFFIRCQLLLLVYKIRKCFSLRKSTHKLYHFSSFLAVLELYMKISFQHHFRFVHNDEVYKLCQFFSWKQLNRAWMMHLLCFSQYWPFHTAVVGISIMVDFDFFSVSMFPLMRVYSLQKIRSPSILVSFDVFW